VSDLRICRWWRLNADKPASSVCFVNVRLAYMWSPNDNWWCQLFEILIPRGAQQTDAVDRNNSLRRHFRRVSFSRTLRRRHLRPLHTTRVHGPCSRSTFFIKFIYTQWVKKTVPLYIRSYNSMANVGQFSNVYCILQEICTTMLFSTRAANMGRAQTPVHTTRVHGPCSREHG